MIQDRDDIVALDSAIIQHPRTWEASGHLAGFTDPLVQCLGKCKRRFREDHLREEAEARGEADRPPGLPRVRRRADRAARVQPDVRDDDRAGEGGGLDRLPAARDRAGHLPRLQAGAAVRAPQAAVRDRAGRQVVPQRDHAGQLHLPHARVRADGDGVLRPARTRPQQWYEHWMQERMDWYVRLGHRPGEPAPARARRRRAVALLDRHERRRVPVPVRLVGARGHRQPRRLRPHAARASTRARSSTGSTRRRATATSRT